MMLHIKHMVCPRCIMVVEKTLSDLEIKFEWVKLGVVKLTNELNDDQYELLNNRLLSIGFELLDDKNKQLVEKIKNLAVQHVSQEEPMPGVFSETVTGTLNKDYSILSKLFSNLEGITIEHYLIELRIEKVKELLTYGELTLSEIADQLGYSSVAHLSAQFKKTVGITPSEFKTQATSLRKPLSSIGGS